MLSGWNPVRQIIACSKFLWVSYKPLKNGAYNRNTGRAITTAALTYAACSCLVKSSFISSFSSTSIWLPRATVKSAVISETAVSSISIAGRCSWHWNTIRYLLCHAPCSTLWFLWLILREHVPRRFVVYPVKLKPTVGLSLSTLAEEMYFYFMHQWLSIALILD